ncbi:TIGR02302 family protein [Aquamicrobium terrae]
MTDRPDASTTPRLPQRLLMSRAATRAAMIGERIWPLVLPLLLVAGLFVSLSWFGVLARMPDALRIGIVAIFAIGTLAALWPLRRFRLPSAAEVDRRIEAVNRLEHSPVQALSDRPSGTHSPFGEALWREHQKRMAARLGRLDAALPAARVPERDPWGLRAAVALLLVTSFAFSFGPLGGRLTDGFRPAAAREAIAPRIDAWVTPPPYTGKAPMFLTADANRAVSTFTVPQDSTLSLRVTGGSGEETLSYAPAGREAQAIEPAAPAVEGGSDSAPVTPAASGVRQFAGTLTEDGELVLQSGRQEIGRWAFSVTPDKPPVIRFAGEPKRAVNGTLELQYEVEDDYGPAAAEAEFAQAEAPAPDARPLYDAPEMTLNLPRRGSKANAAKTSKDLTEHVWAGSAITLTLSATDDAGQSGRSEAVAMVMPERSFTNPLARAVIEQRRLLGLDANAKQRVLDLMDAVTLRPEDTFDSPANYLALMSARTRLKLASGDDQLRDVVSYLWQVALGIEDGNLSAAEQRLRQAQQALQDALRNGATDEEISKLMQELRQAMNDFLREFAQRNQNQNNAQMPQNGQQMRQSDLDRMLDQIENLARSGNREQAEDLLAQLQDMMNNLQMAQPQQGQPGQQGEFSQQMNKLGEIMRRQQEMMNETFRMDQTQRGDNGQNGQMGEDWQDQGQQGQQGQQGEGQGQQMTPEELAEALKQLQEGQGQLQQDLQQLGKDLEGLGMQPNEGFGQADRSMGQAGESLGQGEGDRAVGHQGRALEALRQGAREMMQQLQAMMGEDGQEGQGGRQQSADRDPLGRPRATQGPDFGDSVKVPDEIDVQRARQILEAIRKRLGDALAPDVERSYLERLLELK